MNNIVFENIIFSHQQTEGTSDVWKELIQRIPKKIIVVVIFWNIKMLVAFPEIKWQKKYKIYQSIL
jgi:hypothetical protein